MSRRSLDSWRCRSVALCPAPACGLVRDVRRRDDDLTRARICALVSDLEAHASGLYHPGFVLGVSVQAGSIARIALGEESDSLTSRQARRWRGTRSTNRLRS